LHTGQTVLDLGCGEGPLLRHVARRDFRYVGLDFSASSKHVARKTFHGPQIEFLEADAGCIPLPDASFDRVLSHMVLHVMNPVDGAISEISRVLKPKGKLLLVTPAYWRMDSSVESKRFKDTVSLFSEFKDFSHQTEVATGKFTSEASIHDAITSNFSAGTSIIFHYVDLLIHRPPTEALNMFICGRYDFDLIYDEHKPEAAKCFLKKLISMKDEDGIVRLRRPMSIVEVSMD
jgi:SAM-dependent methyltransferase